MQFKPTKTKIIGSLIVVVVWTLILINVYSKGLIYCEHRTCAIDLNVIAILTPCSCIDMWSVLIQYFMLIIPGILAYALMSLTEKSKKKKSKRKGTSKLRK
ncbi:MAG: hypothetical protein ABIA93_01035 [Candidatus Woesearchaeota archaeon]